MKIDLLNQERDDSSQKDKLLSKTIICMKEYTIFQVSRDEEIITLVYPSNLKVRAT